jgi:7-cyano-7-deazaguanine synthase
MNQSGTRALVLFSGGQDSTVCLAWALARYAHVETVGFDYGQRHRVELDCRAAIRSALASFPQWHAQLGADHVLDIRSFGAIGETAMTTDAAIEMTSAGLPNTFVPGRNIAFFTYAAALACRRGIAALVGGMCETDFSGYPDCRDATLQTLAKALRLGTAQPIEIVTPLMWIDKAATWGMADELGGMRLTNLIIEATHTCYLGERGLRHEWGYGCVTCPACRLRAAGWKSWRQQKLASG